MPDGRVDVVIIGSGAGGGTMARSLAETSARILVIERGDYVPQEDENWSPDAVWRQLRRESPVFFQKHGYGPGFWAVTRYDDVVRLSSDRRLSSSGGRSTTGTPAAPDSAIADILVCTDPPRHTGRWTSSLPRRADPRLGAPGAPRLTAGGALAWGRRHLLRA